MAHADLEVVGIVRRSDFYDAGSKRWIDVLIGDYGNSDVRDGNQDISSDQSLPALVVRMHCKRNVAKHRFRPRGCYRNVAEDRVSISLSVLSCGRARRPAACEIRDCVKNLVEVSRFFAVLRLFVTERCHAARAPVNDAMSPINQPALVQLYERFADANR